MVQAKEAGVSSPTPGGSCLAALHVTQPTQSYCQSISFLAHFSIFFSPLAFKKQVGLTWRSGVKPLSPRQGVFSDFHCMNSGVQRHVEHATVYSPSSSIFLPGTYNVSPLFTSLSSRFCPPSASGPRPFLAFLQCRGILTPAIPSQSCCQPFGGSLWQEQQFSLFPTPVSGFPSGNLSGPGHLPATLNPLAQGSLTLSACGTEWLCLLLLLSHSGS